MERGNHYLDKGGQIWLHSLDTCYHYLDRGKHGRLLLGQGSTRVDKGNGSFNKGGCNLVNPWTRLNILKLNYSHNLDS
jgi:hypothetical protein